MKQLCLFLISLFIILPNVNADPRPVYEMRGLFTDIWYGDVDYFSPPIVLVRSDKTASVHRIDYAVNRYTRYCSYWQDRCVAWDGHGRCIRWERVCVQWDYRVTKVPRRAEIDFRRTSPLSKDNTETYELQISLSKPYDQGDDQVMTWLKAESTIEPVRVRKLSEDRYVVEKK